MKKVVILSKAIVGKRPIAYGLDRGFNPFRKPLSKVLQDNLNTKFKELNMDYQAVVDKSYGNMEDLIKEGADTILISPYIREYVNVKGIKSKYYYMLNEEEFVQGKLKNIINLLDIN